MPLTRKLCRGLVVCCMAQGAADAVHEFPWWVRVVAALLALSADYYSDGEVL